MSNEASGVKNTVAPPRFSPTSDDTITLLIGDAAEFAARFEQLNQGAKA